jgi:hypothetical protein
MSPITIYDNIAIKYVPYIINSIMLLILLLNYNYTKLWIICYNNIISIDIIFIVFIIFLPIWLYTLLTIIYAMITSHRQWILRKSYLCENYMTNPVGGVSRENEKGQICWCDRFVIFGNIRQGTTYTILCEC